MNILSEIGYIFSCMCGSIIMIVGFVEEDACWEMTGGFIVVISLLVLILNKICEEPKSEKQ